MALLNSLTLPANDGTKMPAYAARPSPLSGPVPGIILLQEVFGVNSYIRIWPTSCLPSATTR